MAGACKEPPRSAHVKSPPPPWAHGADGAPITLRSGLASIVTLLTALAVGSTAAVAQRSGAPAANPMHGRWTLDRDRTRYGPGVDRRASETMTCSPAAAATQCVIMSVRVDGARVVGRFTAIVDGPPAAVTGIAGIDRVRLTTGAPGIVDATFSAGASPVFGYRAFRSDGDDTLFVVSVDPVSRVMLTTLVAYRKQ